MTLEEGLVTGNWCYCCEGFRNAVWATGPIPVDGADPVEDLLRATCEVCGSVIALSPQATPRLREALASRQRRFRTTIRVQKDLATAVAAALSRSGVVPGDFDPSLFVLVDVWTDRFTVLWSMPGVSLPGAVVPSARARAARGAACHESAATQALGSPLRRECST